MAPRGTKNVLVQQFAGMTGVSHSVAQQYLQAHAGNLDRALNAFFDESSAKGGDKEGADALAGLFNRYMDADEDAVTTDGALAMFGDLGIAPDSVAVLVLSCVLEAPSLGRFHRAPYVDGWTKVLRSVQHSPDEVLAQQRAAVPALVAAFDRNDDFDGRPLYKRVYDYAFLFARAEGQKSLPLEIALALWDMVLPHAPSFARDGHPGPFSAAQYAHWKRFLTDVSGTKVITRDTWTQFLEFTHEEDAVRAHDFDAAWPSLIDDYVAWARENTQ